MANKGFVIAIEGCDGSGKHTQAEILYNKLKELNYKVKLVSFPNYEGEYSIFVKKYLSGDFGKKASDINPYMCSIFYTLDRYGTYQEELKDFYEDGGILIMDRYTESSIIHQSAKIYSDDTRMKYIKWLYDLENNIFKLPKSDIVIYLDVEPSVSLSLRKQRAEKIKNDIHENDYIFLTNSYNIGNIMCKKLNWNRVVCSDTKSMKKIEKISEDIFKIFENKYIKNK